MLGPAFCTCSDILPKKIEMPKPGAIRAWASQMATSVGLCLVTRLINFLDKLACGSAAMEPMA